MILSCGTTSKQSNPPTKDLFKTPMPPYSEIDAKLFEAVKNNDRASVLCAYELICEYDSLSVIELHIPLLNYSADFYQSMIIS